MKKIFPKACSERGFPEKCDEICRANVRCFHYVLECLLATLIGLYRHARNPLRFSLALSLYRIKELSGSDPIHRDVMLDVLFGNQEVVCRDLFNSSSFPQRNVGIAGDRRVTREHLVAVCRRSVCSILFHLTKSTPDTYFLFYRNLWMLEASWIRGTVYSISSSALD